MVIGELSTLIGLFFLFRIIFVTLVFDEDRLEPAAVAQKIKNSTVFIACLTDEYVKNKDRVKKL